MSARMVDYMRMMMREKVMGTKIERAEYDRDIARGDGWELHLSDCVDLTAAMTFARRDWAVDGLAKVDYDRDIRLSVRLILATARLERGEI